MKNGLPVPVKSSAAPVWILAIIAFFRLFFTIAAIVAIHSLQSRTHIKHVNSSFTVDLLLVALLAAEAFIYWKIRKKIYKRSWVTVHLLLMAIVMVVIPLIYLIMPVVPGNYNPFKGSGKITLTIYRISYYSFWACVVTGNAFFLATVIKSFQFKKVLHDDTGLMDI